MAETYTNPVYPHSFPDPFVLKWCGEYWAYCTGTWRDGRCFGILRSRDLVTWSEVGGAMQPLPGDLPHYWAPEVSMIGGRFFMYYSAGVELEDMAIRVAVADHPAGPFEDAGVRLTDVPFAIDAHVFTDDDGTRYLFYATDYLEHTHVGTGTAVVQLRNPLAIAGESYPATRARYDWQVYDPQRQEKGGVRWHTVEGSYVLKRKGRYYQMFSAGNWQNPSYGVSYATSDTVLRPDEWDQHADGRDILPILRTIPGRVVGPGHNSAVRGPDNRQLYCIYHRWIEQGRAMAIDPLDWAGERMLVLGPTDTPQPAPIPATIADFFDVAGSLGPHWHCRAGTWRAGEGVARSDGASDARAICTLDASCFVAEVSMRQTEPTASSAAPHVQGFGITLLDTDDMLLEARLVPGAGHMQVRWHTNTGWQQEQLALAQDFDANRFHLVRVEVDHGRVCIALDECCINWRGVCATPPRHVALHSSGMPAAFAGFALTPGFEDLFEADDAPIALGWLAEGDGWHVNAGALQGQAGSLRISKAVEFDACEMVINARALDPNAQQCYAIYPAIQPGIPAAFLAVERDTVSGWQAVWYAGGSSEQCVLLPEPFDAGVYQQWRLRRRDGRVAVYWEQYEVGVFDVARDPTALGLGALADSAFEMVRVTARPDGAGATLAPLLQH